jgi:hypothetical protein
MVKLLLVLGIAVQAGSVFACPVFNSAYRYQSQAGTKYYLQVETSVSPQGIYTYLMSSVIGNPNKAEFIADGQPRVILDGRTYTVTCADQTIYIKSEYLNTQPNPNCGNATNSRYLSYANFSKEGRRLRQTVSNFSFCPDGSQYYHDSSNELFEEY